MVNPLLYEISAWPWLERLTRTGGSLVTLDNVPPRVWDDLAARGFGIVYLMGVWQRSAVGRRMAQDDPGLIAEYTRVLPGWQAADVPGSAYSIAAYEPDARVGGWHGLDAARAALASRGLKLFVDFVPNHTGFDHPWVASAPDRYVQGTADAFRLTPDRFHVTTSGPDTRYLACGRDPFFPPWRDVAQLNYCNPDTREAMIGVLQTIAAHADGVRCDMAMLALTDVFEATWRSTLGDRWPAPEEPFWPEAIRRVPSLVYLAEVYWGREWELQRQGFDFTYDKRLLDRLLAGDAAGVRAHLGADADFASRLARFLENHDEPRSAAQLGSRVRAAAAIALTAPGLRFVFDGQLQGARIQAPVQLGRWPDEPVDPALATFYDRLLAFAASPLCRAGDWRLLDVRGTGDGTEDGLVVSLWRNGLTQAIVAANLAARDAQGFVDITLPAGAVFGCSEQLSGEVYSWKTADAARGLYLKVPAGGAQILMIC